MHGNCTQMFVTTYIYSYYSSYRINCLNFDAHIKYLLPLNEFLMETSVCSRQRL